MSEGPVNGSKPLEEMSRGELRRFAVARDLQITYLKERSRVNLLARVQEALRTEGESDEDGR